MYNSLFAMFNLRTYAFNSAMNVVGSLDRSIRGDTAWYNLWNVAARSAFMELRQDFSL
jgi:hypothetical protein